MGKAKSVRKQMEREAIIKRLAEMPCPWAHEGHDGYLASDGSGKPCSTCHGTGARFPWLRQPCPRCGGTKWRQSATGPDYRCDCHPAGWVPHYGIRLEEAIAEVTRSGLFPNGVSLAPGGSLWMAFWQAMDKAVSQ